MSGDILDLIDNALDDCAAGSDAMRWAPERSEEDKQSNATWHALLPGWERDRQPLAAGTVTINGPVPAFWAIVTAGTVLDIDSRLWRVTRRTENAGESVTFDLEEA